MGDGQQTASTIRLPAVAGFVVDRTLIHREESKAWLATDESGRRVVLKELEEDCLLRGQLHPMIRDRLEHVRDLAHLGVAQLFGVVRSDHRALLVWEYVEGKSLEETPEDVRRVVGEVVRQVEALHALGVVHGAIHERNVIVDESGRVTLTHISPLLYSEPEGDVQAVIELAARVGVARAGEVRTLRELSEAVREGTSKEQASEAAARESDAGRRWGLVVLALCLAAAGAAVAWWIWRFTTRLNEL